MPAPPATAQPSATASADKNKEAKRNSRRSELEFSERAKNASAPPEIAPPSTQAGRQREAHVAESQACPSARTASGSKSETKPIESANGTARPALRPRVESATTQAKRSVAGTTSPADARGADHASANIGSSASAQQSPERSSLFVGAQGLRFGAWTGRRPRHQRSRANARRPRAEGPELGERRLECRAISSRQPHQEFLQRSSFDCVHAAPIETTSSKLTGRAGSPCRPGTGSRGRRGWLALHKRQQAARESQATRTGDRIS